jgi:hypothetical protein
MSEETPEFQRIHELVGALSDAFWQELNRRNGEPGFSALTYLTVHYEGECRPDSTAEAAVWDELTNPRNYDALVSYVDYCKSFRINDYATRLHATLLTEAQRRRGYGAAAGA